MALEEYIKMRDFQKTPEPKPEGGKSIPGQLRFVVQKHWASRLHYDFRLETEGGIQKLGYTQRPVNEPFQ